MILYQIFRCWTVYNRSWRIAALPVLLILYNIATLLVGVYWEISYNLTGNEPISLYEDGAAVVGSYYAANIGINIYTTCK